VFSFNFEGDFDPRMAGGWHPDRAAAHAVADALDAVGAAAREYAATPEEASTSIALLDAITQSGATTADAPSCERARALRDAVVEFARVAKQGGLRTTDAFDSAVRTVTTALMEDPAAGQRVTRLAVVWIAAAYDELGAWGG
jgi:hypothetical protein